MRPGGRGGSIQTGNPGNKGGGRPPSALREKLRGSFAKRLTVIEDIADGAPTQRTRIMVKDLAPYVACPNCGELGLSVKDAAVLVDIDATVSASPRDRLGALDLAAKYGLGALKEISQESVRERVKETLAIVRRRCPAELAALIVGDMRPVWL